LTRTDTSRTGLRAATEMRTGVGCRTVPPSWGRVTVTVGTFAAGLSTRSRTGGDQTP
jgi:hypothetical protein